MTVSQKALVLLYQQATPVSIKQLGEWASYGNVTRWRTQIVKGLEKKAFIHVDGDQVVLLYPGEDEAQRLILEGGGL